MSNKNILLKNLKENLGKQGKLDRDNASLNKDDASIVRKLMQSGPPTPPADSSGNPANNSSNNTTNAISRKPVKKGKANPKGRKLQRIRAETDKQNTDRALRRLGLKIKPTNNHKGKKHNIYHHILHVHHKTKNEHQVNPHRNPYWNDGRNLVA